MNESLEDRVAMELAKGEREWCGKQAKVMEVLLRFTSGLRLYHPGWTASGGGVLTLRVMRVVEVLSVTLEDNGVWPVLVSGVSPLCNTPEQLEEALITALSRVRKSIWTVRESRRLRSTCRGGRCGT